MTRLVDRLEREGLLARDACVSDGRGTFAVLTPKGEDVACVLETEDGRTVGIGAQTVVSTFMVMPPDVGGGLQLQQAIARYTWDGESANGMLERSSPPASID